MNLKKPTIDDLKPLYEEATEGQTEEQWLNHFTASIAKMLKKNPLWYRAYGMYWWGVKKQLIERELIVSDFIDADWVEKVQYDNPAYLLLAAFAYHDERQDMGALFDELHVIEMEDGTVESYTLIDEDFEMLAVAKSLA
ncbi:hypothetical protein [Vibrio parahaemolyticus]|uniref:hypothetical protein n=1 Tax=Vibrio parahaemolyticus TaxID=670 RepID=UPI0028C1ED68|nr:hypothetical protein [Vibrio parahaemolyticus]MEA5377369.1 hypothetical protein [Vibrio parahaemolyticus]HDY8182607.1 hypothetical protein [Vibrio vulnificus]HDZ9162628.1 hypothetical protein [Vibrio cholerae]